jgi:hypothetical protein
MFRFPFDGAYGLNMVFRQRDRPVEGVPPLYLGVHRNPEVATRHQNVWDVWALLYRQCS